MLMPIIARGKGLNALITGTIANLNLKTWLMSSLGWDGTTPYPIDVTIDASAIIYGSTTANYALTISGFPAGTVLRLTNNGRILGAGGKGGNGGYNYDYNETTYCVAGTPGGAGGNALSVAYAVSITNNYRIWGGGGGGGGGGTPSTGPGGSCGGGGAGYPGGQPGCTGTYGGGAGTETAGGAGGTYSYDGGAGGGPGLAGSSGQSAPCAGPGAGGAAGKYAVGNSHITWLATGDRRGGVS